MNEQHTEHPDATEPWRTWTTAKANATLDNLPEDWDDDIRFLALGCHKSQQVRRRYAAEVEKPVHYQAVLAHEPSMFIRMELASCPGTDPAILAVVGMAAEENLVRLAVACHPATPGGVLDHLVKQDGVNTKVLEAVARHRSTSRRTLAELSYSPDLFVAMEAQSGLERRVLGMDD